MCWQLDPTEGPCRERRKLMLVPRNIDSKYILDEGHKVDSKGRVSVYSHLVIYRNKYNTNFDHLYSF